VVGSRGHGGFGGMLLGSTSQALIYHATCPLLVARQPGEH
ncbi:MAG TPA: universal stress protein, partial [Pseudonocardiaceae bacterium]